MQKRIDILGRHLSFAAVITVATFLLYFLAPLDSHQEAIVRTICIWGLLSLMIILAEEKQPLTDARHTLSVVIIVVVVVQMIIVLCVEPLLHHIFVSEYR